MPAWAGAFLQGVREGAQMVRRPVKRQRLKQPYLAQDTGSERKKRGRQPDERRKIEIARAVLLYRAADEYAIIQGTAKPKYSRWTSRPLKTAYSKIAAKFGVSVNYVQKVFPKYRKLAIDSVDKELQRRAKGEADVEAFRRWQNVLHWMRENDVKFVK